MFRNTFKNNPLKEVSITALYIVFWFTSHKTEWTNVIRLSGGILWKLDTLPEVEDVILLIKNQYAVRLTTIHKIILMKFEIKLLWILSNTTLHGVYIAGKKKDHMTDSSSL